MPEEGSTQAKTAEEQAAKTAEENKSLENFEWDDGEGDFFGVADSAVETEEVVEVIKKVTGEEGEETVPVAKTTTEEVKDDEDFFGVKTTETPEGEVVTTVVEENQEDEGSYKSIASKMKEGGILQNMEIPEDEELTEDKFIELQDKEIESRVDEAFEGFFEELDEDAAAFLKFKKEGGNTSDFLKAYGQNTGAPTGDLDDETHQERVSRYYYAQEGDDPDEIDDKIEWLKSSGKLEKYSAKFDQKIKDSDKEEKELVAKQAKAASKASDEGKIKFANTVQETLDNTDQVDSFIFTKESKKSLLPFITKPTVKVGKNKYITGMQSKLGTALRDPEKMLILAQLLQNDFDVSDVINADNTSRTKKLKNDIQRKKGSVRPKSSGKTGSKRGLADFF
jgi:hypothetical protein